MSTEFADATLINNLQKLLMAIFVIGHQFNHNVCFLGGVAVANQHFAVVDIFSTNEPCGAENAVIRTRVKDSVAIATTGNSIDNGFF